MLPLQAGAASQKTYRIPEEYLPHIDAFTISEANLPEAGIYANMLLADVTDFVNVRKEPSTEAEIVGRIYDGAVAKIIKFSPADDSWVEISSGDITGYVKAEYFLFGQEAAAAIEEQLANGEELTYALSMEELNIELRQSIVDFALQYLGGPYVHGGNSLTKGTDCSGFTSLIYAEFGYSLSRTPSGQHSNDGTKIEYSEILPGDIICYTSNGKTCTHVALYIGDGQIIHAANAKKGIVIYDADYSTILGVKRILN